MELDIENAAHAHAILNAFVVKMAMVVLKKLKSVTARNNVLTILMRLILSAVVVNLTVQHV